MKKKTMGRTRKAKATKMKKRSSFVLNEKEARVLKAIPAFEKDEPKFIEIADIASTAFPKKGTKASSKPNSWVRNSLRKLVRLGLVKMKGYKSGEYQRTELTPEGVLEDAETNGMCPKASAEGEVDGEAKKLTAKKPKAKAKVKAKAKAKSDDKTDKPESEAPQAA